MTTNKPGSVNQQPLYGCTSCYEDWTWPAGDLRVFGSECWCDLCWDERRWDFPDQPSWNDLEPYTPALQAAHKEDVFRVLQYSDAHFEALMQALEQVDALKAECEKLRKDVTDLVEALERVMYCNEVKFLPEGVQQAVSDALAAHHIKENGNG